MTWLNAVSKDREDLPGAVLVPAVGVLDAGEPGEVEDLDPVPERTVVVLFQGLLGRLEGVPGAGETFVPAKRQK